MCLGFILHRVIFLLLPLPLHILLPLLLLSLQSTESLSPPPSVLSLPMCLASVPLCWAKSQDTIHQDSAGQCYSCSRSCSSFTLFIRCSLLLTLNWLYLFNTINNSNTSVVKSGAYLIFVNSRLYR